MCLTLWVCGFGGLQRTDPDADGELERARRVAIEVLRNHDTLLKAWNGG